jgi:hypothetical protein
MYPHLIFKTFSKCVLVRFQLSSTFALVLLDACDAPASQDQLSMTEIHQEDQIDGLWVIRIIQLHKV